MQHDTEYERENKMEEQSRSVHEAGEWLGRGNTPGEVIGFGRGDSRGVLKEAAMYCLLLQQKGPG